MSKDTITEQRLDQSSIKKHMEEEHIFGEEHDNLSIQIVASDHVILYPEKQLTEPEAKQRFSMVGKAGKGDGYTYLQATCTGMSLTDVSILTNFQHLQFINVSNNYLTLEALQPLTKLPYLITLQADVNNIKSAALNTARYLQVLRLNNNKISSVQDVYHPNLSTLEMSFNKLSTVSFEKNMPDLRCLDFKNNFLTNINHFEFLNLDSLYLAGNRIISLEGLDVMINLRILHLRNNPIRKLDGFSEKLVKLQYINLRNCKISTLKQIKRLRPLKALEILILKGCPFMGGAGEEDSTSGQEEEEEEDPGLRIEVLAALMRLKRLNKNEVTREDRAEAKQLFLQWLEEDEKDEEIEDENLGDQDQDQDF